VAACGSRKVAAAPSPSIGAGEDGFVVIRDDRIKKRPSVAALINKSPPQKPAIRRAFVCSAAKTLVACAIVTFARVPSREIKNRPSMDGLSKKSAGTH
jgi:hypothetical protein